VFGAWGYKKQEYKNPQERNRSEVSKPRIEKFLEKKT
jgi:hypothetical protein